MTESQQLSSLICSEDLGILWDWSKSWNTSSPVVSECLEKTFLVWFAIILTFVFLIFHVWTSEIYGRVHRAAAIFDCIACCRVVTICLALLCFIVHIIWVETRQSLSLDRTRLDLVNCLAYIVVFVLLLWITILHIRHAIRTSGAVWMSLFALSLSMAMRFAAVILHFYHQPNSTLDFRLKTAYQSEMRFLNSTPYFNYAMICIFSEFTGQNLDKSWFRIYGQNELIIISLEFALTIASLFSHSFALKLPSDRLDDHREWPELKASFASKLTFHWIFSLVLKAYRSTLQLDDIYECAYFLKANTTLTKLTRNMHAFRTFIAANRLKSDSDVEFSGKEPSILWVLCRSFGGPLFFSALWYLVSEMAQFGDPLILGWLIQFTTDLNEPTWHGYIYVLAMFIVQLFVCVMHEQSCYVSNTVSLQLRASLTAAIYTKSLSLSANARQSRTVGEVVNIMSVDAYRVSNAVNSTLNTVWAAPLVISIAFIFLYNVVGVAALAGFAVFVLLIPFNYLISHFYNKWDTLQMEHKDERIKLMSEILNGMKIIKLYAWEPVFQRMINLIRRKELKFLGRNIALGGGLEMIWGSSELIACLTTFGVYVWMGHSLTPKVAFVSLSLFNKMLFPLSMFPMVLADLIQLRVSLSRIARYLLAEELPNNHSGYLTNSSSDVGIELNNASFTWKSGTNACLGPINMQIVRGSLVGVVGRVGSGKSSLIGALCGEMELTDGNVHMNGSVGYASQEAWIQNMSVKDNVLFDQPCNQNKYTQVVEACALTADIKMLVDGDRTEIGERGINLSGGQKQRVSLARALYQDCDVYLLDDPLSAVDVHVAKHIFNNVIGEDGFLKHKTRLLVTHSLTYLHQCDLIIVVQDGQVCEQGSYLNLVNAGGIFAKLIQEFLQQADEDEINELSSDIIEQLSSSPAKEIIRSRLSRQSSDKPTSMSDAEFVPVKKDEHQTLDCNSGRLIDEETLEVGKVSWGVYMSFMKAAGAGMLWYLLFLVLYECCTIGSAIWLQHWSDSVASGRPISNSLAFSVYAGWSAGQNIFCILLATAYWFGQLRACKVVHKDMLTAILRAPMSFFDTNPVGRLVNRFSKDIDAVDCEIAGVLDQLLHQICYLGGCMVIILYVVPWFAAILVPVTVCYFFILRFYVSSSRQLRRMESISMSPVFSHFQETLQGVSIIRAFKQQERFVQHSNMLLDRRNAIKICSLASVRWLGFSLGFLGDIIVCSVALLAIFERGNGISPGMVGLCVAYAMDVISSLSWGVRMAAALETEIVAMERIEEFKHTESEALWRKEDSPVDRNWPREGAVTFHNYSTRYRPGLELVLKDISLSIKPGEKIGVVGRTGAGKSSLSLALFRLIEPSEGSIVVDGVSLADCGLHDIRERFSIIPQDPVLFCGTLRMNLDPLNCYSDDELWNAVNVCHLNSFISSLPEGLSHMVTEAGTNLSVGQRQLICLARAILRSSRIVVLDEATAAVDMETDALVQTTIRQHFNNSTVITIAHRINTIMDSNRIVVLDAGRVVEFAEPHELLKDKSSAFYAMAVEAGVTIK